MDSFVSISPKGLNSLYEGTMAAHNKLNIDVKTLFRRLIAMGEGQILKVAIAADDPLVKLMEIFEEEMQTSPGSGCKSMKMKKKLFAGTPPSNKKSKPDVESKTNVEYINID